MLRTKLMTTMLLTAAATGSVACGAPSATVTNVVPLNIDARECVMAGPRVAPLLVDIAADVEGDVLFVPTSSELTIQHGDGPYAFIGVGAALFFSIDGGALAAFPADAASARTAAAWEPVLQPQADTSANDVMIVSVLHSDDLAALRDEDAVVAALTSVDDRLRLDLHLQIVGVAAPLTSEIDTPLPARSSFITVPIDLCDGCLTTTCFDADEIGACFEGVDRPSRKCAAE